MKPASGGKKTNETKVTNEKKRGREEVKPKLASKLKLATGSKLKSKLPSWSSSYYSEYSDSDIDGKDDNKPATGGTSEAAPKPKPELESELEEQPDWGDSNSPNTSESDEEPAPPRPTESGPTIGSNKGDLPATGGIKEDDEKEDFNEDDETEEWQWTEPPWRKKVKHVENGGMWWQWQESSWEYYQPASGGGDTWPSDNWRNHWQSQGSWWSSSSDQWERQQRQPSAWTSNSSWSEPLPASGGTGGMRRPVLVHTDARCRVLAPVQLTVISKQFADALADWAAFSSSSLFLKDGLDEFARRSTWMAKKFQEDPPKQWVLQTDLPMDPSKEIVDLRPASGGASQPDRMSIKDAVARHRGEVRELPGGYWASCEKEPATTNHPQLQGLISRQASGCTQAKVAKVCSLMDIFSKFGHEFSAKELYAVYLSFPLIARRRMRPKSHAR